MNQITKNETKLTVTKSVTKCYDCKTETQCFIDHEVFENGHEWTDDPRCSECYKSNKLQWRFEEIFGSHWDTSEQKVNDMIPAIKRLSDKGLYQFLMHVGERMEF